MPDVKGMGIKDALYLLENQGIKVEVEGIGRVKSQSINAGQTVTKGSIVKLKLG